MLFPTHQNSDGYKILSNRTLDDIEHPEVKEVACHVLAMRGYLTEGDAAYVQGAMLYAIEQHDGQTRKSGEPYVTHPLRVTRRLVRERMPPDVLAAGLLHDVVEDCQVPLIELQYKFGAEVAHIVDGVTKVKEIVRDSRARAAGLSSKERELEMIATHAKMLDFAMHDGAVVVVKLADVLDNLETLGPMPVEHQQRKSKEAVEIYVRLCDKLGIGRYKRMMYELTFQYLWPEDHRRELRIMDQTRDRREQYIERVETRLAREFEKDNISAVVSARPRSLYSVYRKRSKHYEDNRPLDQISDLIVIQVIAEDNPGCYAALCTVHRIWREMPNTTISYISEPKSNGYESIHTYVYDDDSAPVQVLFRTQEQHECAEVGVLSRWRYRADRPQADRRLHFAPELEDASAIADHPEDIVGIVRDEVLAPDSELVSVFTTEREEVYLPKGSTALDFAFKRDPKSALSASGAVISGKWFPLNTELEDQQTVAIQREDGSLPNIDWCDPDKGWLNSRANRVKLKNHFASRDPYSIINDGLRLLKEVVAQIKLIDGDPHLETVAREADYESCGDLILALGRADVSVGDVVDAVADSRLDLQDAAGLRPPDFEESPKMASEGADQSLESAEVVGHPFVKVEPSDCCRGLTYGDIDIVAYLNATGGAEAHRRGCHVILSSDRQERVAEITWRGSPRGKLVTFLIKARNGMGIGARIFETFARRKVNVERFETVHSEGQDDAAIELTAKFMNSAEVRKLVYEIEKIKGVDSVERQNSLSLGIA